MTEYEVKPAKIIVTFNCRLSLDLDIDTFQTPFWHNF